MMAVVTCLVYDLSNGNARSILQPVLGIQIDIVPHTGIQVFDKEYFFGDGIQCVSSGQFAQAYGLPVHEEICLGTTTRTQKDFEEWLDSVKKNYTEATYDILTNNCNKFSEECAKFLLGETGKRVPAHILDIPSRVMNTTAGKLFMQLYNNLQAEFRKHGAQMSTANAETIGTDNDAVAMSSSSGSSKPVDGVFINIKLSNREATFKCPVPSFDSTIDELMASIVRETGYAISDQRLIFNGRILKDKNMKLSDCGVIEGVVVHLVPKPNAVPRSSGSAGTASSPIQVAANVDPLEAALRKINAASEKDAKVALRTILKIVENVVNNPLEEKYRHLKRANPALSKSLDHVDGAIDCLFALGFKECKSDAGDQMLSLEASESAWEKILEGSNQIKEQLSNLEKPKQQPSMPFNPLSYFGETTQNSGQQSNLFSGLPDSGAGLPNMDPESLARLMSSPFLRERMQQITQNPQLMQSVMNGPIMQQMASRNPVVASVMREMSENPELLTPMLENPELLNQMFENPAMQAIWNNPDALSSLMRPTQQHDSFPAENEVTRASSNATQRSPNPEPGQDDTQMSEEEMIQEAIRRSLQEE